DSARVAGALTGTGGVALVGMGPAYAAVAALYLASFLLSIGLAAPGPRARASAVATRAREVFTGLRQAVAYVWGRADLLGALCMAFLITLFAFPFTRGLLPYVAKEVFAMGQSGLGWLACAAAIGALAGSVPGGGGQLRPPWAGRVPR